MSTEEDRVNPRDLAERLLSEGLKGVKGRLRRLAQMRGLPYMEERQYSTVCPKCNAKMVKENGRFMRCPTCGFRAHSDNVPVIWAEKRYWEIRQKTNQQTFSAAITFLTS